MAKSLETIFKYFSGNQNSLEYFDQISFKNKEEVALVCSAQTYGGHLELMNLFINFREKERSASSFLQDLKKAIGEGLEHRKIADFQYLYYQPSRNQLEIVSYGTGIVSFFIIENASLLPLKSLSAEMAQVVVENSQEGWKIETIRTKTSFLGVLSRRELNEIVTKIGTVSLDLGNSTLLFKGFCQHISSQLVLNRATDIDRDNTALLFWMGKNKLQLVS